VSVKLDLFLSRTLSLLDSFKRYLLVLLRMPFDKSLDNGAVDVVVVVMVVVE
jgi:hypothetical protein